jgi:NTE family protein
MVKRQTGVKKPWPASPYKGLGYYEAEDWPLFAGRDSDLDSCADLLSQLGTRILIVHGTTGCGKSSFLRAGLIRYLEDGDGGFRFRSDAGQPPLLVTSTFDPLSELGLSLFDFASGTPMLHKPNGRRPIDLSKARLGNADRARFAEQLAADPDLVLESLRYLARAQPGTLVVIIDQAEEVLTLKPGRPGQEARNYFFNFLHRLNESAIDLRLLLVMRTEYHGRFVNEVHRRDWEGVPIREYLLRDLNDSALCQAIVKPTSADPVLGYGTPFQNYRFEYESGLAERLAADLLKEAPDGGVLPIMQLVCSRLYARTRKAEPMTWKISLDDYVKSGGVKMQIDEYLQDSLLTWCREAELAADKIGPEVQRWRGVLHGLTSTQPDGTVTTALRPEEDIVRDANRAGCAEPTRAVAYLAEPQRRILRPRVVYHRESGVSVKCFSLGHDMIGLALTAWKAAAPESGSPVGPVYEGPAFEKSGTDSKSGAALCLSGWSYRAVLFHVGAIWRLNEAGLLPKIERITSVDSSSIVAAFLTYKWSSLAFNGEGVAHNLDREVVEPLRRFASRYALYSFWRDTFSFFFPGFVNIHLPKALRAELFGSATLQDLPDNPCLMIGATNVQSTARWIFSKSSMGDGFVGAALTPLVSLADAVAASAAIVLVPMRLQLEPDLFIAQTGGRESFARNIVLTSGGLTDPLGLENAWSQHKTVLVSDANWSLQPEANLSKAISNRFVRGWDLTHEAFRQLRRRQVREAFTKGPRDGAFWSISPDIASYDMALPVPIEKARQLANVEQAGGPIKPEHQARLINWGYAVCDAALRKHYPPRRGTEPVFPYPGGV